MSEKKSSIFTILEKKKQIALRENLKRRKVQRESRMNHIPILPKDPNKSIEDDERNPSVS